LSKAPWAGHTWQPKFKHIEQLDIYQNENINNIKHLNNLINLRCNNEIDQDSISKLKLIKLDVSNNTKINNLNHMKNTFKQGLARRGLLEKY